MDHPTIQKAMDMGYPYPYSARRQEVVGIDPLGNEVHRGDEILILHDEFYLRSELMQQSIEVLESLGATYVIAE